MEHGQLAVGYSSIAAPIRGYASQLLGAVSVTSTSDDLQVERVVDALYASQRSPSVVDSVHQTPHVRSPPDQWGGQSLAFA